MTDNWSRFEVEACVADYLRMLTLELSGQTYNKSEHRRALAERIGARSAGSIEMKHRNVSAVLQDLGYPYITGYKPAAHYQQLLMETVVDQVSKDRALHAAALSAVEQPASVPMIGSNSEIVVDPPKAQRIADEPPPYQPTFAAAKRDYLAREAQNRSLGHAGELFVLEFEARRLHALGKPRLADRVEHASATQGDGLGYDVLSFDVSGRERHIEVKTTSFGKETPFYISRNEIAFSKLSQDSYHLYRLFEFRKSPKLFDLPGVIEQHCKLDPVSFMARFV